MKEFNPIHLTWTALLGRWVEFARSAVALPQDEQGQLLRQSVADIIMLQAVWFALQHLDDLADDQRALGLDRAAVLIDRHARALVDRWSPSDLPGPLRELIQDARIELDRQKRRGME